MAVASPSVPPSVLDATDQHIQVSGVTWDQYEAALVAFNDHPSVRLTYREGELDIMVVSASHERVKKMLARLVEIYALERGIDLNGYGQMTFRNRDRLRGLEPDECYVLGTTLGTVPDLAIEVALTSAGIDKLDVYAGLRIPEVWVWRNQTLEVWRLRVEDAIYERRPRSVLLPDLDLDALVPFVAWPNQTAAVRAFRDTLTAPPRP